MQVLVRLALKLLLLLLRSNPHLPAINNRDTS
jgi:hypothetical protein